MLLLGEVDQLKNKKLCFLNVSYRIKTGYVYLVMLMADCNGPKDDLIIVSILKTNFRLFIFIFDTIYITPKCFRPIY
jgi:hypothetical protein